jgi:hypothetical protein
VDLSFTALYSTMSGAFGLAAFFNAMLVPARCPACGARRRRARSCIPRRSCTFRACPSVCTSRSCSSGPSALPAHTAKLVGFGHPRGGWLALATLKTLDPRQSCRAVRDENKRPSTVLRSRILQGGVAHLHRHGLTDSYRTSAHPHRPRPQSLVSASATSSANVYTKSGFRASGD